MSTVNDFKAYGDKLFNEDEILKSFLSKKRKTIKSHDGRITLYIRGDIFVDYIKYIDIDHPEEPPGEINDDLRNTLNFCCEMNDLHHSSIERIFQSPTPEQTHILSRS